MLIQCTASNRLISINWTIEYIRTDILWGDRHFESVTAHRSLFTFTPRHGQTRTQLSTVELLTQLKSKSKCIWTSWALALVSICDNDEENAEYGEDGTFNIQDRFSNLDLWVESQVTTISSHTTTSLYSRNRLNCFLSTRPTHQDITHVFLCLALVLVCMQCDVDVSLYFLKYLMFWVDLITYAGWLGLVHVYVLYVYVVCCAACWLCFGVIALCSRLVLLHTHEYVLHMFPYV